MNNKQYEEFKAMSEKEQREAASKMTLQELRDLGQLAAPDLAAFLKAAT